MIRFEVLLRMLADVLLAGVDVSCLEAQSAIERLAVYKNERR